MRLRPPLATAALDREAPVRGADKSSRRLLLGLGLSAVSHALLLLLRFGAPGPGGGAPQPSPPLLISLAPDGQVVAPPAPAPVPDGAGAVASAPPAPAGMRLVASQPAPVTPVSPVRAVTPRRISTALAPRDKVEQRTRVIAQDQARNDFTLPMPQPLEAERKTVSPADAQEGVEAPVEARVVATPPDDPGQAETAHKLAEAQAQADADAQALATVTSQAQALQRQHTEERRLADLRQQQALREQEAVLRQQAAREREAALQQQAVREQAAALQQQAGREREAEREQAAARQRSADLQREQALADERRQAEARRQLEQARQQQAQRELSELNELKAQQERQQQQVQARLAEQRRQAEPARQEQERVREQQEQAAREQAAREQSSREQAERGAAAERARAVAVDGGGTGAGAGAGGAGPGANRAPLGSAAANRVRELARGVDLLGGAPPVHGEDARGARRVTVGTGERDVVLRMYVDSIRMKIERNGGIAFAPQDADRVRIEPLVSMSVRSDGSVDEVTILRSSGRPQVDEAVRRIIRVNARYSAFPPNIAARYDVIDIRRVWSFTDTLRLLEEVR
ncbi:energy transducer TonB [Massilia sp. DWR3-1-1]|uniref:energy transducer TonB n=1 Tax=Massilia sp. DWR3-1-1 TaxID=2804559 RepID=UPI003CE8A5EF